MRVLVADDDEITVVALDGMLRHLGHEAVVARTGTAAWELIRRDDAPSLAILDWMMPDIEGPEICRRVREDRGAEVRLARRTRRQPVGAPADRGGHGARAGGHFVAVGERAVVRVRAVAHVDSMLGPAVVGWTRGCVAR